METITWNHVEYTTVYYENVVTDASIVVLNEYLYCRLFTQDEITIIIKQTLN